MSSCIIYTANIKGCTVVIILFANFPLISMLAKYRNNNTDDATTNIELYANSFLAHNLNIPPKHAPSISIINAFKNIIKLIIIYPNKYLLLFSFLMFKWSLIYPPIKYINNIVTRFKPVVLLNTPVYG